MELYTQCLVLSKIELGDSLSKVQIKTGLSFTTIQKTVRELEKRGIIKVKENITERGRAKECVKISQNHKRASIFIIDILAKMSCLLSSHNDINPLLFEMEVLEESLKRVGQSLSKDTWDIFNEWLKSSDGRVKIDNKEAYTEFFEIKEKKIQFFSKDFEIIINPLKKEEETTKKVTLDKFM